jgi:hypothetical protein
MTSYVRRIIDKLLAIQDRFYPETKEYYRMGSGKVALVRIVGIDGDSVLLKCDGYRITYASEDDQPVHIFRMTVDTFLNILSGEEDLREAIAKGHFVIENASTGTVDIVELEKWAKAFERLRGLILKYSRLLKKG